jgi:threonine synthase
LILRALRETNGIAIQVDDGEILSAMKALFKMGVYACPEAAATLAAFEGLWRKGELDGDERVLLCITGNAMKYFDIMRLKREEIPVLPRDAKSLD